jgi:hypothetical protein
LTLCFGLVWKFRELSDLPILYSPTVQVCVVPYELSFVFVGFWCQSTKS